MKYSEKFLLQNVQHIHAYKGVNFTAVNGANLKDPLTISQDLVPGDAYYLNSYSQSVDLPLVFDGNLISLEQKGGDALSEKHALLIDSILTFITDSGQVVEAFILVAVDELKNIQDVFVFSKNAFFEGIKYTLIGLDHTDQNHLMSVLNEMSQNALTDTIADSISA